ncbi:MAG: hypothetical protein P8M63_00945 [Paracoccaceae bacterium]|jgi:hypothetical protein|nr:hypothetical protein [Paracoccaceae bacterium]
MAISQDIIQSWRRPAVVMRRLLDMGTREDRVLAILMGACLIIFIAQLPRLSRTAHLEDVGLDQLVAYEFLGWLMIWPLAFYVIAAISHLIARIFGAQGTFYTARLALFWSLLASTPAVLLHGLVAGFIGAGPALTLVGAVWAIAFLLIWSFCFREAEFRVERVTS